MTKGRIEVISVLAIYLAVLLLFSLSAVSALPNYYSCNNGQGVLVYASPEISGCDVDCSTCGEKTTIPCSGSPVRSYNECSTSSWNCGKLNIGESSCVGLSDERYLDLPFGSSSTFLTPLINKGYYYTHGSCDDATYNSAWDSNFRMCVEIFNENGQAKARYHGFFLGDRCSGDDETVSLSSTEFNKNANKRHYCGGYCQPSYTFYCSAPGSPKTELGCQIDGEVCYKGFNVTNPGAARGYCDDGECKNLNFWIESVTPIQVLEGFDWIENKPGMIRVKANFDNKFKPVEQFPDEKEDVKINLILWKLDETEPYFPISWTKIWEIPRTENIKRVYSDEDIKKGKNTINFFDIKISEPGSYRLEAIADPDNNVIEYKEDDNKRSSMLFRVREVDMAWSISDKLRIIYVPIAIGRWKEEVNAEEFRKTVLENHEFIRATYPLDPEKIGMGTTPVIVPSNLMSDPPNDPALEEIYFNSFLWRLSWWAWGEWLLTGETTRFVGVVPDGSMSNAAGLSTNTWYHKIIFLGAGGVVIESGTEHAAAHEIAHTFGLGKPEEYDSNPRFGNVVQGDGWWVIKGAEGSRINLDEDRSANDLDEHLFDIIEGDRREFEERFVRWFCFMGDGIGFWIDAEDYQKLIDKFIKK